MNLEHFGFVPWVNLTLAADCLGNILEDTGQHFFWFCKWMFCKQSFDKSYITHKACQCILKCYFLSCHLCAWTKLVLGERKEENVCWQKENLWKVGQFYIFPHWSFQFLSRISHKQGCKTCHWACVNNHQQKVPPGSLYISVDMQNISNGSLVLKRRHLNSIKKKEERKGKPEVRNLENSLYREEWVTLNCIAEAIQKETRVQYRTIFVYRNLIPV